MTLAHSISYPVLLLGGILGALLGSNVFRSIWLGKRRGRSSVRNPPTSGSFGRRMLESFFGFLRATFSGGDSFTSNKYCAEKSSPGKLKWWRRSMLPLIFFAVGGAFVGAFPGLVLLRHMDYVVELERDFEEFFHVRRKVIVIIAVSILVVYYLLLLLAVVKSLPRAMYRGHGKMAKKQKRDARIAKKDQMALRQFLNPTKYHRALKAYAAYERAKTEKFD